LKEISEIFFKKLRKRGWLRLLFACAADEEEEEEKEHQTKFD